MHYEHHFGHGHGEHDGHGSGHGDHDGGHEGTHHEEHTSHHDVEMPAGVLNLPIQEHEVAPPTLAMFEAHPRWAIIEGYMSSDLEPLWRIGIIEADNMLADALREKGYQGEDLGEMLKNAHFATIQLAWDAHKVRNRIAHEGVSFIVTPHEAKRVYALYEAVFKEMKLI